jgi:hypothetical protein
MSKRTVKETWRYCLMKKPADYAGLYKSFLTYPLGICPAPAYLRDQ